MVQGRRPEEAGRGGPAHPKRRRDRHRDPPQKGHTAEEVVNLSDELEADLIVVGIVMGVGAAERKILEGLSDDIVHHAQCPVMVMRTREQTEAVR